jgi:hypothetical protein
MSNGALDFMCAVIGAVLIGMGSNWMVGVGAFFLAVATKR